VTIQVMHAENIQNNYGIGMAVVAGGGAVVFGVLAAFGPEAKELRMATEGAPHRG
jgi:hypothetical protein